MKPDQNDMEHKQFRDDIKNVTYAIYGNPETGDMGMKVKVDEIHNLLIQTQGLGKVFKIIIYVVTGVGGAILALEKIFKIFK